jgi:hypothetical protein
MVRPTALDQSDCLSQSTPIACRHTLHQFFDIHIIAPEFFRLLAIGV